MRAATFLWAVLAAIVGTGLFLLKYQVQAEERHLKEVRKDIAGTEQSIHVLKAEWSYLNDPLRLRDQAERHLDMRPMRANQIVEIEAIPMIGEAAFQPPGLTPTQTGRPSNKHAPTAAPAMPGAKKAPPPKPAPGKMLTAKAKIARSPEVASSRIRP